MGSQGDVRPFVALAGRLRGEGHEPVLAAPALYQGLATAADVAFVPLDLDMTEVGRAVAGRHGLRHLFAFAKAMGRRAGKSCLAQPPPRRRAARWTWSSITRCCRSASTLRRCSASRRWSPPLARAGSDAGVPVAGLAGHDPAARAAEPPSYHAARYLTGAWCRRDVDAWRRATLGLGRRPGRHDPLGDPSVTVLHSFSPHVVPRPADWPATAHVTGYWFTGNEPTWSPPRRLTDFLDAGDPPVYLGFGSMPIDSPATLAEAITMAARRTGARFIVHSLNPELTRRLAGDSKRILTVRQVPHDWLFPRTAAVVHHGGAGTTGAAVAAGRPQVIWPFGVDQHFWASRMTSLGVAVPAGRYAR